MPSKPCCRVTTTGQDSTTLANSNLPFPLGGDLPVSNDQPSVALTYLVATSGLFPNGIQASPQTPHISAKSSPMPVRVPV